MHQNLSLCVQARFVTDSSAPVPEQDLVPVGNALVGQDIDGAVVGISGGERRRVSVGISLVTDARALFLDEPTTGLDSEAAESLVTVLARLASSRRKMVHCPCSSSSLHGPELHCYLVL